MRLYVIQHGKPVSKEIDPDRPLSDQGVNDVRRMAEFLKKRGIYVEEVLHSGKTRARQTAETMTNGINPDAALSEKGGLAPLDDPGSIADYVKDRERDLMIVGHLPHLSKLVSLLVSAHESVPVVTFQQGGVVCLEKGEEGNWSVIWMLIPGII